MKQSNALSEYELNGDIDNIIFIDCKENYKIWSDSSFNFLGNNDIKIELKEKSF